ncbi:MAG: phosphoenolpyruvate--protein phosphotransferase [Candidatus Zixiibacteriota bacterium]
MAKPSQIQGISASAGVALGEARVVYSWDAFVGERSILPEEVAGEKLKVDLAIEKTIAELTGIRDSAGKTLGGAATKIFDAQLLIAGDFEFLRNVKERISTRLQNAESVYSSLVEESTSTLRKSRDPYMRQMLTDIEAVSKKALAHMSGESGGKERRLPENTILVAKKLTPAETLRYHEQGVAAVVTSEGSAHSHMSLIARALYMPAVVGVDRAQNRIRNGVRLIVDGGLGKVFIDPHDALWESYRKKLSGDVLSSVKRLSELEHIPPVTTDGQAVELAVNVELPGPSDKEIAACGIGVGLYRTEFIYLQSNHFPDEARQFDYYDNIAAEFAPQPVVLRTFDLGSDKYVEELQPLQESNPALGWRGIRTSLGMPAIFKPQLRAILRASTRGNVRLLLPMLTDIGEWRRAQRVIKRVMVELRNQKVEFDQNIPVGVMIEVPSAALTAECFARQTSFLAIGTNDLAQYTLAVDRDNNRVADLYRMFHPANLKLIKMTIDAAHKYNRPVSICGEMASETLASPLLVGMGATSLSMSPSALYQAAALISALSLREMNELAARTLAAQTLKETEHILREFQESARVKAPGAFSEET